MRARGVMLLEVMLALALTIVVGMVVLGAVSRATGSLRDARETQVAVDLARSAMARLEAGIESTTTLTGPVKAWAEDQDLAEVSDSVQETGWELVVESEPSEFPGLTYVAITARRTDAREGSATYTLRQLVRLASKEEDEIGEQDEVMIEAERGAERERGRRDREQPPEDDR